MDIPMISRCLIRLGETESQVRFQLWQANAGYLVLNSVYAVSASGVRGSRCFPIAARCSYISLRAQRKGAKRMLCSIASGMQVSARCTMVSELKCARDHCSSLVSRVSQPSDRLYSFPFLSRDGSVPK